MRRAQGSKLLAFASVTRSTAPPSKTARNVGPRSGHPAQITTLRTPSWSYRATQPPGGTFRFPPSLPRSTQSRGQFLNPLVVPEVAQLSHPYTAITSGRGLPCRGSGIASQSRAQSPRAPSAPRASSARGSVPVAPALRQTPAPLGQQPSAPAPPSALVPQGRGRAERRCAGRAPAGRGVGGWGGDQVLHVRVDVVEAGVVVVVVVVVVVAMVVLGVVRRHLLDTRGDATHGLDVPCPAPCPSPPAPTPRPACPRVPMSRFPPFPLGPLLTPSPWLGRTPSPLVSGPCRGSPSLSAAPLPVLLTPVSFPCPCPCPWLCHRRLTTPWPAPCAPLPLALEPCLCPCVSPRALLLAPVSFPCPCPFPALCPASRRLLLTLWPAPCAYPPPLPLPLVPCPCPCLFSLSCASWPVPCVRPWALLLSPPVPRSALVWPVPCPCRALSPPSWITRRASRCRGSRGSVTPGGVRVGAGRRTGRDVPLGKAASGRYFSGGLVWVWLGLVWARYLAPSLPSTVAAAAARLPSVLHPVEPLLRSALFPFSYAGCTQARIGGTICSMPTISTFPRSTRGWTSPTISTS